MRSSHKQDKYTLEQSYALLYEQVSSDEQMISNLLNDIISQVEEQLLAISKGEIASKVEGILDDLTSLQANVDDGTLKNDEIEGGYPDGIPQQARANSMKDTEDVIDQMKSFTSDSTIQRILDTNLDMFDPDEEPGEFLESIAEELRQAGYSDQFIQKITGLSPDQY